MEFLKNVSKVVVVGTLGLMSAWAAVSAMWEVQRYYIELLMPASLVAVSSMLVKALVFLVFIAGADNLWQRFQWRKKLRMSHQEMKDEFKESEGDPHLKGRRRMIAREMARNRIADAVPKASVILTNPTHFAVALARLRRQGG